MSISLDGVALDGDLRLPAEPRGVVAFAHGSGSGRRSPRNRMVAGELGRAGLATLLLDLLTAEEEREDLRSRRLRFDIGLLADRMTGTVDWLAREPTTAALSVGLVGASTGAAAALVAAARRPQRVGAVVSRGGRPDLAGDVLATISAPLLLIVGGDDLPVIELNHDAMQAMRCECRLEIVPGATHLFEEPGALERVADLAGDWFVRHLGGGAGGPGASASPANPTR